MTTSPSRRERWRGLLLGTCVGDALGLPREGLSPRRARRLFGETVRHRFVWGRGMVSDDTEHTLFVSQCLLAHPGDATRFAGRLAWCLRGWLLGLPAGVGFATLRAGLRLWLGVAPSRSGVRSAGNGAAMRSTPIGALFAGDPGRRDAFLTAATRLTHTHPQALIGARAVAGLAAWTMREELTERPPADAMLAELREAGGGDAAWDALVDRMDDGFRHERTVAEFARSLGLDRGVTGYVFHTVPVAAYAWYRGFGDFQATLQAVIELGGDTDTTGAIAGALAGAVVGELGIPPRWIRGVWGWPRGPALLTAVADRLADLADGTQTGGPVRYLWPGVVPRNILFLALVLAHGVRRLAPPY